MFVMYYIYGVSVPSLLIESTDSMIRNNGESVASFFCFFLYILYIIFHVQSYDKGCTNSR